MSSILYDSSLSQNFGYSNIKVALFTVYSSNDDTGMLKYNTSSTYVVNKFREDADNMKLLFYLTWREVRCRPWRLLPLSLISAALVFTSVAQVTFQEL